MAQENFRDLMRLVHGFEAARIFLVAVEQDLFTPLEKGCRADELAELRNLDARAVELLLNALVATGVLEKRQDRFYNGPAASSCLVAGDNYRGHIFRHIGHCWDSWSDLDSVVRDGAPREVGEDQALGDDEVRTRDFIRGMDDVTRELAPEVVGKLDLNGVRVILDVGGGPGRYASTFLESHPEVEEVRLFDLPGALEVARENLQGDERVKLVPGDFTRDRFEDGVDLVWVSQVLHSLDEQECQELLSKAASCLNPGGRVLVHEFLLDDDLAGPPQAALFAVHMLVLTAGGRAYSGKEVGGWMAAAGLNEISVSQAGPDTRVVAGRLPAPPAHS
jgi:SAM-dependent methyltransferase